MRQTLDAIYQDGVFRPLVRPRIREGQRVRLEVEQVGEDAPNELLELAARVYEGLSEAQIDEIEQIALDRSDFFGEGVL